MLPAPAVVRDTERVISRVYPLLPHHGFLAIRTLDTKPPEMGAFLVSVPVLAFEAYVQPPMPVQVKAELTPQGAGAATVIFEHREPVLDGSCAASANFSVYAKAADFA